MSEASLPEERPKYKQVPRITRITRITRSPKKARGGRGGGELAGTLGDLALLLFFLLAGPPLCSGGSAWALGAGGGAAGFQGSGGHGLGQGPRT